MILAGLGFSTKMQHQQTRCTIILTSLHSATLYGHKVHNGEQLLTVVKLVKERLMLVIVYLSKVLFLTSIPLIYYRKSSIKPPPPAYLCKAHLRGGLVETEGLFEGEGLFI